MRTRLCSPPSSLMFVLSVRAFLGSCFCLINSCLVWLMYLVIMAEGRSVFSLKRFNIELLNIWFDSEEDAVCNKMLLLCTLLIHFQKWFACSSDFFGLCLCEVGHWIVLFIFKYLPLCHLISRCSGGQAASRSEQTRHNGCGWGGEYEWVDCSCSFFSCLIELFFTL